MAKLTSPEMVQGVPLAQLPSEAGSKRSQPEYPTQEDDVAAPPPLKRIKPNEPPSHPFTFNFQQPGQPSAEQPGSAAARHQAFVFTAGAQSSASAPSKQNSWQDHGHGAHAAAQPQSLTPTGQSSGNNDPCMGLGGNTNGHHPGSVSTLPPGSLPHSMYHEFAPPTQHFGHPGPPFHLANAAAAYGHSYYGTGSDALLAYQYGVQPPSYHMGYPGMHHPSMHPAYAAFAAQAMPTQYPYPPQLAAPYLQTPSLNSQPSSELPPPPPPLPPV